MSNPNLPETELDRLGGREESELDPEALSDILSNTNTMNDFC